MVKNMYVAFLGTFYEDSANNWSSVGPLVCLSVFIIILKRFLWNIVNALQNPKTLKIYLVRR